MSKLTAFDIIERGVVRDIFYDKCMQCPFLKKTFITEFDCLMAEGLYRETLYKDKKCCIEKVSGSSKYM